MATGGGWRNRMLHVGMVSPCHGGGEWGGERFCGIFSLAKIWTEELRDSGGQPARDKPPPAHGTLQS